jgi:hypothetical protein
VDPLAALEHADEPLDPAGAGVGPPGVLEPVGVAAAALRGPANC